MEAYKKSDKLGEGTYGVVYKALIIESGEHVALKTIRLESEEEGVPCTALREISLLKALRHPNIVRLYNVHYQAKSLVIVFEFVDCELKRYMDSLPQHRMPLIEMQSFMCQLLRGVGYCHDCKVLHRDLKPQNLLITKQGVLKIADFGLGRAY
eukprot:gene11155-9728_t